MQIGFEKRKAFKHFEFGKIWFYVFLLTFHKDQWMNPNSSGSMGTYIDV